MGVALQLDPGALVISTLSLCVSIYAAAVARGSHSKLLRRDEFAPFRDRIAAARNDLAGYRDDLRRAAEPTVPLEGLVDAFDNTYAEIDRSARALRAVGKDLDELELFGGGWEQTGDQSWTLYAEEFDCVQSSVRDEPQRRAAAVRAIAALDAFDGAFTRRINEKIREHVG